MSYLRLIINPEDDSAFLRIINTPKRAIGPVTLEKLGLFAQENNLSLLSAAGDQRLTNHGHSKESNDTTSRIFRFH